MCKKTEEEIEHMKGENAKKRLNKWEKFRRKRVP
jgi:hypothetical protein